MGTIYGNPYVSFCQRRISVKIYLILSENKASVYFSELSNCTLFAYIISYKP